MSAKILIVDDETNVLRVLGYALEAAGYLIVTAESGEEALRKAVHEGPDLMILDVRLPDVPGTSVCRRLRARSETANLPIIMLSAKTQVPDKIKGLQAGADEYVTKPFDSDEMVARVTALLDRNRRLLRTSPTKRGNVLGFLGAKGGVGTTTIALNTACALAMRGGTVIAAELRSSYGTCSLHLGQTPQTNLRNLLELAPEHIDEQELRKHLVKCQSGLRVLFGPKKGDTFKDMEPNQAEAVIKGLAGMADYTILGLACHLSDATGAAVLQCDLLTLVVEHQELCWAASRVIMDQVRSWGFSGGQLGVVVVNRSMLSRSVKLDEIGREHGCDVLGVFPPAEQACIGSHESKAPIVLSQPASTAASALIEITDRIEGKLVSGLTPSMLCAAP